MATDAGSPICSRIFPFATHSGSLAVRVTSRTRERGTQQRELIAIPGGFEIGSTSMYDGGIIVERSLAIDEPVSELAVNNVFKRSVLITVTVYVSMNYRVAGVYRVLTGV